MFMIYVGIILITAFFIIFGYYNELAIQEQRQYDKLKAVVSATAINIDGDRHDELMDSYQHGDSDVANDPYYREVNRKLKQTVSNNSLNSAMYTLVYNEADDAFYYGVRSDDFVDFKNQYAQTPDILKKHFEEGGIIPLYESENGMWMSAFHPITTSTGKVIGVVEADIKFSEFKAIVINQYLKEVFIALAVIIAMALFFIPSVKKILAKEEKRKQQFLDQKRTIEAKNRDITDSIRYALKIQSAMLPPLDSLEKNGLDGFIFHQPKDIVAGDFYWIEKHDDYLFFAVADCTGHGVPGAIVSILCSTALNRAVEVMGLRDTDKILDRVREIIISRLGGEGDMKDGMDVALCRLNLKTKELQFSGANNPLYIHWGDKEEMEVIKCCKQPVGQFYAPHPFQAKLFQLRPNDTIYLFTDGFADQFGGPLGKKYKYRPFRELLVANSSVSMDEQKVKLRQSLREWMRDFEQIDDVCVMGVKI